MSQPAALISFEELNHLLVPLGALNSPSQLHGFLAGKLSGGARPEGDAWMAEAIEFLDLITDDQGVVGDNEERGQLALARLYPTTLAQLQDDHFGFQLLLPADDADVDDRSVALGEWCHGFLAGLGSARLDPSTKFSPETADALRDLAAIANVGIPDESSEEEHQEAQAALEELIEYVRVAVMTLFGEVCGSDDPESGPTLH